MIRVHSNDSIFIAGIGIGITGTQMAFYIQQRVLQRWIHQEHTSYQPQPSTSISNHSRRYQTQPRAPCNDQSNGESRPSSPTVASVVSQKGCICDSPRKRTLSVHDKGARQYRYYLYVMYQNLSIIASKSKAWQTNKVIPKGRFASLATYKCTLIPMTIGSNITSIKEYRILHTIKAHFS